MRACVKRQYAIFVWNTRWLLRFQYSGTVGLSCGSRSDNQAGHHNEPHYDGTKANKHNASRHSDTFMSEWYR